MQTRKFSVVLIISILLTACVADGAKSGKAGTDAAPTNTLSASCLVKITYSPDILNIDAHIVDSLIYSNGVAGKAVKDIFNISPDVRRAFYSIEPLPGKPTVNTSGLTTADRMRLAGVPGFGKEPGAMPGMMGMGGPAGMPGMYGMPETPEAPSAPGGYGGMPMGGGMGMSGPGMDMMGMYGGGGTATMTPYGWKWTGRPDDRPAITNTGETFLFRLSVNLDKYNQSKPKHPAPPRAQEFMNELVANLRGVLDQAHRDHQQQLDLQLHLAKHQVKLVTADLESAMGLERNEDDIATNELLESKVNLSALAEYMTFADAIEVLRNSVKPPLPIVVMWADLTENAFIEQEQPIMISGKGLSSVRLGKGLKILLQGLAATGELGYYIEDGIVTVASKDFVSRAQDKSPQNIEIEMSTAIDIARKQDLLWASQASERKTAQMKARRGAIQKQIIVTRHEIDRKVVGDPICQELKGIIDVYQEEMKSRVDGGGPEVKKKIAMTRIELARRREEISKSAGGNQLDALMGDLTALAINFAEEEAGFAVTSKQLVQIERRLEKARSLAPQMSQIKRARQNLDNAQARVSLLTVRLAGLQAPNVSIIGGQ